MSANEIDEYLATLEDPKRRALEDLRATIMSIIPGAEQGLSYGVPAFKLDGKTVAGFAAFKNHLSYMPHSGSILAELADEVVGYETSKGSLRFALDRPLPKSLVMKLIEARLSELASGT